MQLDILYKDDYLVAINKPHNLMVHRSSIARDVSVFALQLLRDQLNKKVFPAHRIDRKTGGVLLFALYPKVQSEMHKLFRENKIYKTYYAIVRGFTDDHGIIDYPIKKENGQYQEAITTYKTMGKTELEVPFGKHPSSRYSLVEITPKSGRMHQIRKHLSHIDHPIIGDRPHGCNKQNRLFKERWQMKTMLLHAYRVEFEHPVINTTIIITAPFHKEFMRMMHLMGWEK